MHATVSVAHKTLLIIRVSLSVKVSKNISSRMDKKRERQMKQMMVPKMPKKLISPRFWKKRDFLRLYPAAKMMGGKMIEKKMSLLN
jgi:hypothetical protein